MRYELINNFHQMRFDGLQDFSSYALSDFQFHSFQRENMGNGFSNKLKDKEFVGRDFSGSLCVLRKAFESIWPEGMDIFASMLRQLDSFHLQPPKNIWRRSAWSEDSGDDLCLDRLRYQQPFWRTTKRDHRPGPVNVTIVADVVAPSIVGPDEVLWRGAACVVLTHLLESAGYRINLFSVCSSRRTYKTGRGFSTIVELKKCEEPLDVSSLVNAVSGWAFRTAYFAARWRPNEKMNPSIGKAIPPDLSVITSDNQAILCSGVWSEQAAIRWVKEQLAKFETGAFQHQGS